jgi:hypothetical protein
MQATAVASEIAVQRRHDRAEHVLSPSILTGVEVSPTEETVRRDLEPNVPGGSAIASARSANTRC